MNCNTKVFDGTPDELLELKQWHSKFGKTIIETENGDVLCLTTDSTGAERRVVASHCMNHHKQQQRVLDMRNRLRNKLMARK